MSRADNRLPSIPDLLARYLQKRQEAQAAGLINIEVTGAVVPFEAGPVQPIDPRPAWDEAVASARCFNAKADTKKWKAPPDWPTLVSAQEPAYALAFCVGNFPQLVRNLHPLLRAKDLGSLRPAAGQPLPVPDLLDWAQDATGKMQFPQVLLALAGLRLAKQFESADKVIEDGRNQVPSEWSSAWSNEEASLAWHKGDADKAAALWQDQSESVPILFNRGMSSLFLNKPAQARPWLNKAVAHLPEDDAWHHLGKLYLALAEMSR